MPSLCLGDGGEMSIDQLVAFAFVDCRVGLMALYLCY